MTLFYNIQDVRQVSRLLIIFGTWYHFQGGSLLESFSPWSFAGKSTVHYTWCQWLPVVIIVSTQVFVGSRMGWLSAKGWLRPTTSDCLTLFSWGCPICLSSSCVCIKLVFMFLWNGSFCRPRPSKYQGWTLNEKYLFIFSTRQAVIVHLTSPVSIACTQITRSYSTAICYKTLECTLVLSPPWTILIEEGLPRVSFKLWWHLVFHLAKSVWSSHCDVSYHQYDI